MNQEILVINLFVSRLKTGPVFFFIKADSKKNTLAFDIKKNCFTIDITAKAEHNAANDAIELFLSKKVGKNIKIIRGKKSIKKYVKLL